MYEAGNAVLKGDPVYHVKDFVYPPFAADLVIPLSLLSRHALYEFWRVFQIFAPLAGLTLATCALVARRDALWVSGLVAVVLLKSDLFVDSLFLFNPTVIFVLPLVSAICAWGSERWSKGSLVLALSLAVKPLLVLLFLIPALRRRWRSTATVVLAAAALTVVGVVTGHDVAGLLRLPSKIAHGTNLQGALLSHNVSLGAVAQVHPGLVALCIGLGAAGLASLAVVLRRLVSGDLDTEALMVCSTTLVLVPALLGSLDEIHYGLLGLPGLLALVLQRRRTAPRLMGAATLFVLLFPRAYLHLAPLTYDESQVRWAVGQSMAVIAAGLFFVMSGKRQKAVRGAVTVSS